MKPNMDSTNCILVQDVKAVTHDQMTQDTVSTQQPTEESLPTSTAEHSSLTTHNNNYINHSHNSHNNNNLNNGAAANGAQQLQQQSAPQAWPAVTELRDFNVLLTATIPPYSFWNSEFRNKQPAFLTLNFTLPWGANFAVYGRRNVAPSVTQYDFVEFIKGGRVDHRLRRKRQLRPEDYQHETNPTLLSKSNEDPENDPELFPKRAVRFTNKKIRNMHKSDILDSISNSYEGTQKILADAEKKEPFYVPHSILFKINRDDEATTDLPHPTLDLNIPLDEHMISKRSATNLDAGLVNVSILQYLDTGRWFLSI